MAQGQGHKKLKMSVHERPSYGYYPSVLWVNQFQLQILETAGMCSTSVFTVCCVNFDTADNVKIMAKHCCMW